MQPEPAATDLSSLPPGVAAMRVRDKQAALGMAVNYLMGDPAFARLPFGFWSRVLVGQVNRGHYLFVTRASRIVGFVGWAYATRPVAEAWLSGKREIGSAESMTGEIVLINAWKADSAEANRFVLAAFRPAMVGREMVFAKRFYKDGRVRPLRVNVNAFVERHIAGARASPAQ